MLPVRHRTMAITCLLLLACDGHTPTDLPTPGRAPVGAVSTTDAPGTVADLAMTNATDTSVTVTFTAVSDGLGGPASYDVRYAADSMAWGSATPVSRGSCSSPVTGSTVGARKSCTLAGLAASTKYALQLVAFRGTLNLNAVFGALSSVALGATIATPPPVVVTAPGAVNDLSVASATDTSITLAFTEVSGGAGSPANYDVRYMLKPITWWLAPAVSRGTCSTTVSGTAIGARKTCTILGLNASTAYEMQLVSFRGTLNQNAVFGSLSNATSGTTAQPAVASITVSPTATSAVVGGSTQRLLVEQQFARLGEQHRPGNRDGCRLRGHHRDLRGEERFGRAFGFGSGAAEWVVQRAQRPRDHDRQSL